MKCPHWLRQSHNLEVVLGIPLLLWSSINNSITMVLNSSQHLNLPILLHFLHYSLCPSHHHLLQLIVSSMMLHWHSIPIHVVFTKLWEWSLLRPKIDTTFLIMHRTIWYLLISPGIKHLCQVYKFQPFPSSLSSINTPFLPLFSHSGLLLFLSS